ncbi:MAG: hypothetical protein E7302_16715 [Butyrivibrio sp.]|nr:hypothetical protein [Butyrivibrio sp.]
MEIYEKIDFLMKLTGSKNSDLGKAVSFDPSYISKIRSGSRSVPKNPEFASAIAMFFAKNIKDSYQLEAASHMILPVGTLPSDKAELSTYIRKYLTESDEGKSSDEPVYKLLSDITQLFAPSSENAKLPEFKQSEIIMTNDDNIVPVSVFYGNQGKRDAVKKFLSFLITQKKPFTLHLFSDEDMSWLYESPEFAKEWAIMLIQLIRTGSRIQIIHTISRDLSELMEAIRKWLPIYATGAIEPYFCPKLRDGIYNRSLFIAKGHEALISTSVNSETEGMANFLIRKEEVVNALELEYQNYFAICKPLMKMFSSANKDAFIDVFLKKDMSLGRFIMASPLPSLWTTPGKILEKISKQSGNESALTIANKQKKNMIELLENGGELTEILSINRIDDRMSSPVSLPMSDMLECAGFSYDKKDFIDHLLEIKSLTEKYPNYHVLISGALPSSIVIFSHSESDTIIANSAAPTIAFVIAHQQFSYAFYEYLTRIEKESTERQTLSLDDYISMLKK